MDLYLQAKEAYTWSEHLLLSFRRQGAIFRGRGDFSPLLITAFLLLILLQIMGAYFPVMSSLPAVYCPRYGQKSAGSDGNIIQKHAPSMTKNFIKCGIL